MVKDTISNKLGVRNAVGGLSNWMSRVLFIPGGRRKQKRAGGT